MLFHHKQLGFSGNLKNSYQLDVMFTSPYLRKARKDTELQGGKTYRRQKCHYPGVLRVRRVSVDNY